jgi:hypothetical protein
MKTTIDIADAVLNEAKRLAREQNHTLRDVVEEALRRLITEHEEPRKPYKYVPHTFAGNGVQPGIVEGQWWDLIYPYPFPDTDDG